MYSRLLGKAFLYQTVFALLLLLFSALSFGFSPIKMTLQEVVEASDVIVIGTVSRVDIVDPQGRVVIDSNAMASETNYSWHDEIRFYVTIERLLEGSQSVSSGSTVTAGLSKRRMPPDWVKSEYEGKRGIFFLRANEVNSSIQYTHTSLRKLVHTIEKQDDVLIHLFCNRYGC